MALFTPNSLGARAVRQLKKKKMVLACFGIIAIYLIVAFLGMLNWLPDYQERIGTGYSAPDFSLAGIFGTDVFGRSVFYWDQLKRTTTAPSLLRARHQGMQGSPQSHCCVFSIFLAPFQSPIC